MNEPVKLPRKQILRWRCRRRRFGCSSSEFRRKRSRVRRGAQLFGLEVWRRSQIGRRSDARATSDGVRLDDGRDDVMLPRRFRSPWRNRRRRQTRFGRDRRRVESGRGSGVVKFGRRLRRLVVTFRRFDQHRDADRATPEVTRSHRRIRARFRDGFGSVIGLSPDGQPSSDRSAHLGSRFPEPPEVRIRAWPEDGMVRESVDFIEIFQARRQPADEGGLDQTTSASTTLHRFASIENYFSNEKRTRLQPTFFVAFCVLDMSFSVIYIL